MKTNCSIVMDLLPLYVDGVCREETVTEIEKHLKTCEVCSKELKLLQAPMASVTMEDDSGKRIEKLSTDLKKKRMDSFIKGIMLTSLIFAVGAFIAYQTADVYLLEDGTLVEPFYLIPLGYLAGLTFVVTGVLQLIRKKI